MKPAALAVGALACCAFAYGCAPGSMAPYIPRTPQVSLPKPYTQQGIDIYVDGLYRDGYGNVLGVSGVAANTTSRDFTTVMINLDVLDTAGIKVSSAIASTTGLKAYQKWRFQATFLNPFATSFESIAAGNTLVIPAR